MMNVGCSMSPGLMPGAQPYLQQAGLCPGQTSASHPMPGGTMQTAMPPASMPFQMQPSQMQPSQMQSSQMQSSQMQPSQMQSSQMQPSQMQSSQMQPSQMQSSQMQSSQMQPSQMQSSQMQPSQMQSSQMQYASGPSMRDLLAEYLGHYIRTEHLVGTGSLVNHEGRLIRVCENAFVLEEQQTGFHQVCDYYSLKFFREL